MRQILIFIILILSVSCARIEKRGYAFELSDYKTLKIGLSNKKAVLNAMGHPVTISNIDHQEESWVYFSEDVKRFLFFKPKVLERQIMVITFDDNYYIKNIQNFDLQDASKVHFNPKISKVDSKKEGFWSQIFGNIGQVSPY